MAYKAITGPVSRSRSFSELNSALSRGRAPVSVLGLPEEHRASFIAACESAFLAPLLYVAAGDGSARRVYEDLRAFLPGCVYVPPRETGVFGSSAHSRDNAFDRLSALCAISTGNSAVVVTSIEALMSPLMPPETLRDSAIRLAAGESHNIGELTLRLVKIGYESVDMVEGKGQFSLRGGILDISPVDMPNGVRIEFFGDEIDTLRSFDTATQRSDEQIKGVTVIPASEVISGETREAGSNLFADIEKAAAELPEKRVSAKLALDDIDDDNDDLSAMPSIWDMRTVTRGGGSRLSSLREAAASLINGERFAQIEHYINYIYPNGVTLADYMPDDTLIILDEPGRMRERAENSLAEFNETLNTAVESENALYSQKSLMTDWPGIAMKLTGRRLIAVNHLLVNTADIVCPVTVQFAAQSAQTFSGNFELLSKEVKRLKDLGYATYFLAGGDARAQRLCDQLARLDIASGLQEGDGEIRPGQIAVRPDSLSRGFIWPECALAVFTESEIFGVSRSRAPARSRKGGKLQAFTDLNAGDYIVHENHGVGIYIGTVKMTVDGKARDYLHLKYNGTDALYIPTDQMDRVQKYIGGGSDEPPRLNRLGGGEWERQKSKVRQSVRELAFSLVELYAQREQKGGFKFSPDTPWQREFEDKFPYEETPDQLRSIEEIKKDMERVACMDRLLCGDVGYGKTEVALRAAFKAVMDGKQTAVLVPTTILAQQHYQTIMKRFEGYPVRVQTLSRFKTPKEQALIISELNSGGIDIVVGTHKLLNRDVRFSNLGLLVIDEEQRFGVAHKEQIKALKKDVDVLTLSATPIPRTLHMSMVGLRDISTIETPPEERYPVQTFVMSYNESVIRDAIARELARGGQVYFVYNRVANIDRFAEHVRSIAPNAKVAIAHGQMRETQLEDIMLEFMEKKHDILLCSTIIESGLDIPDVNTMIVFDADKFGLSQLYQLRGRVGRSNRLAYCYLTVRENKMITETAQKRLAAIKEFTEFGSGFKVAMRDLEIRGAGNLIGAQQSGFMASVGYDLYVKLIGEAVDELRGKKRVSETEASVTLPVDSYLPDDYVRGSVVRMDVYKLISQVRTAEDRDDCVEEIIDRFGDMPKPCENMIYIAWLKNACAMMGIDQVFLRRGRIVMRFTPNIAIDPKRLLESLEKRGKALTLLAGEYPSLMHNSDAPLETQIRELAPVMREIAGEIAEE